MTPEEAKAAVATVNEPGGRGQREKKKVVKMNLQKNNIIVKLKIILFTEQLEKSKMTRR